jgi:N-acetylglucosamine-6-sulfatase
MPFAVGSLPISFSDYIVASPLCCPARANFLTGQYGHNNGVLRNHYRGLREKGNILPTWLRRAGYRTAHVGKYLNGHTQTHEAEVPWGWDEWYTMQSTGYFDYELSDNGEVVEFGSEPDDYLTRVLNRRALELVDDYADGDRPFYLQLDHYASHPWARSGPEDECFTGATPDPDDHPRRAEFEVPERAGVGERDVSDKPWFVRAQPRLNAEAVELRKVHFQCAMATLPAVDRGIEAIFEALRERDALDETLIVLTSDNGYFFGEHRISKNKEFPYEENLRMPLLMRLPASVAPPPGQGRDPIGAATANIDLAPTFLELAGGRPCTEAGDCRLLDGRSLLPLLDDEDDWPEDRALLVKLRQRPNGRQKRARPCAYTGVRRGGRILIEHETASAPGTPCRETDAVEHYDLRSDPAQLDNLVARGGDRAAEQRLRRTLERLRRCEGNRVDPEAGDKPCE